MVVIRRIDVGSAARVGAILSGLTVAVLGLPVLLLQSLFLNVMTVSFNDARVDSALIGGSLLFSLICGWLVFIVISAIFGAIYFTVLGLLYNLTSTWVGGVRVELMRVRTEINDPFDEFDDDMPRKRG